ncbi:phosphoribosylanthranilate isomerase [Cyanobacterium sp. Dongsha4]|uniref:phosphoribosylanthranilate isomerase n=1 Tax=Cyanobacterium sp. DS4 TaxID=2878255 RepID=UPI002E818D6E|nr:phosphoribosylanthranilate isomerase [Cyanobacterium sp. Dongsha4]WVK99485.1 phosphoribosylanthranilate isomerase [Cyanobacterium sp. Dongsha4]
MRLKICGITSVEQADAIASLGVDTLGFICVENSPRYIKSEQIKTITSKISSEISKVGVFVNQSIENILDIVEKAGLTGIQLHGDEPPSMCTTLRESLPDLEIIKVFRYQNSDSLAKLDDYLSVIDTILLDTYQKDMYGGTGKTFNWSELADFRPPRPWLLAGGLTPDNVLLALNTLKCDGIDVSSGVETNPGEKDLNKIKLLLEHLNSFKVPLHSSN